MDLLSDYRAKHAMEYNNRIKLEQQKTQQSAEEIAKENERLIHIRNFNSAYIRNLEKIAVMLLVCESVVLMKTYIENLTTIINENIDKWNNEKDPEMMKQLTSSVLMILENVNNNTFYKINFNNTQEIEASNIIKMHMKNILNAVGIIQDENEILDVQYDMDCTADEEYARQLFAEEQQRHNNNLPPQGNRRQRRAAAAAIPILPTQPNTNGTDIVPRRRGRPRRNPLA
jgi:hypothetical protein